MREGLTKTLFAIAVGFLIPFFTFAQVEITEIMYNLEGADSGREWIEVCNTGDDTVSLVGWKFFENGSNHGLTLVSGSESLASGGVAVIVSDDTKFVLDWPSFSGTLYDSAFSLSNTGETLEIRDDALSTQDTVTYSVDMGADGDGKTLNRVNDSFIADVATPGSASCVTTSSSSGNNTSSESAGGGGVWVEDDGEISVSAGEDRVVVVGSVVEFESSAEGLLGEPLEAQRYVWNFGDGETAEGESVSHSYSYMGKYIVVLNVVSGRYAASDRVDVIVVPADISVTGYTESEDGYVEITNDTDYELDVSGWLISSMGVDFVFPENTILSNEYPIRLKNEITGLGGAGEKIDLLFPNGVVVAVYEVSGGGDVRKAGDSDDHTSVVSTQPTGISGQSTNEASTQSPRPNANDLHLAGGSEYVADNMAEKMGQNIGENTSESTEVAEEMALNEGDGRLQNLVGVVFSLGKDKGNRSAFDYGLLRWLVSLLILIAGASIAVIIIRDEEAVLHDTTQKAVESSKKEIRRLAEEIEIIE